MGLICRICESESPEGLNLETLECTSCKNKRLQKEYDDSEAAKKAKESAKIWFEDSVNFKLRDGSTYNIKPLTLRNARILMENIMYINVDHPIMTYIDISDENTLITAADRAEKLMDVVELGFKEYNLSREYLEDNIDLRSVKELLDIYMDLNGIKK